jgi:hypothetical protein
LGDVRERQWENAGHHGCGDTRLLLDLTQYGLDRILIRLDVTPHRQPHLIATMPVKQHATVVDEKAGNGEVTKHITLFHLH